MKFWVGLIIAIICSFWIVKPLWVNGYFPMHDDTQVARVVVMGRALRTGQFPVRWVSDLGYGYGYPIYNFYGPLPYYAGGALQAIGVDSVVATKAMFALGAILASVFFYLFAQPVFGITAAIAGSVLFAYAPYHAVQIYIRGAVGEYWAIAFVPLVLYPVRSAFSKKGRWVAILAGSIGFFGVICSHTILGYITVALYIIGVFIFSIVRIIQRTFTISSSMKLLMPVLIGLGLGAFFWLPAYWEMGSTGVSLMVKNAPTGFYDHFVCLGQLWNSPWGYGGSAPGCVDGMSLKLGKLQLMLTILGIILWFLSIRKRKVTKREIFTGIGIALFFISAFATTQISKPVWNVIPFVSYIQYPWRLLTFSILGMGICAGSVIGYISSPRIRHLVAAIIIIVGIAVNAKLFAPQYQYSRDTKDFETPAELRYTISKISDEYLPPDVARPENISEIVIHPIDGSDTLRVVDMYETDTYLKAQLVSRVSQPVTIKKAYFPGWKYYVNGIPMDPSIVGGLPSVVVLEGMSTLEARFTDTPVRTLGNILSLVSVAVMGGIIYYGKKTNA